MSQTQRSSTFKNREKTLDENRARRKEQTVELRKDKRDEHLAKRRHIVDAGSDGDAGFSGNVSPVLSVEAIRRFVQDIGSGDEDRIAEGVRGIRMSLSSSASTESIDLVIESGVLPKLVDMLSRYKNPVVQYEAAWAITNIASGTPAHTRYVVECGAVPPLVQLTTSQDTEICEQAIWALGNIAGDNPGFRDLVLHSGGLPPLLHVLCHCSRSEMIRNATWTLSNLCRGKNPRPDFQIIKAALPILSRLIWIEDDVETVQDAVLALSYLSDGPPDRIQAVIEAGVCKRLVDLLMNNSEHVVFGVLLTLSNLTSGAQYETQVVINAGVLPNLLHLLGANSEKVRKQACFTLSNITAGTEDQLQAAINVGVVPPLLDCLQFGEFSVRKEACWAIVNALTGGSEAQRRVLVEMGCLPPLCGMLGCHGLDLDLLQMILEALQNVLKLGEQIAQRDQTRNRYADIVEECGGLEHIEQLQQHQHAKVYHLSHDLVASFFSEQNDQEDGMQVNDAGTAYSFAAPAPPTGGFQL